MKLLKTICASLVLLSLISCASQPVAPTYEQIAAKWEVLKQKPPPDIKYGVKGLALAEDCGDNCFKYNDSTMQVLVNDVDTLLSIIGHLKERRNLSVDIQNSMVDLVIQRDIIIEELRVESAYWKETLGRERLSAGVQRWGERIFGFLLFVLTAI